MWLHSQDAHIQMGKQDTGSRAIKNVVMINWLVQEKNGHLQEELRQP